MPRSRPTAPRRLALLGAVAVVAPLLPAALVAPAAAAPAVALRDVREFACPPGQVRAPGAAARFSDTVGSTFELEIDCLAGYEVTLGTGDGRTYGPAGTVTRAQMAQFLARVAARAGVPLDTRDAGFTDIAVLPQAARDAVNAMANAGVALGRSATSFVPLADVRRDQMASFIARLQEEVAQPFPAAEDFFTDDGGTTHEPGINRIAAAGIVQGVAEGAYGFDRLVTRQQMAAFLTRYLDGQVAAGEVPGRYPRTNQVVTVSPMDAATLPVGGERSFAATGLSAGVEYRVTLVESAAVRTGGDSTLRFSDTDGDRLAEGGSYAARITTINGRSVTPVGEGQASTAVALPDGGRVAVTVTSDRDTDDVIPVFYPNTGRSPRLELAADLRPVEAFGVGGRTTFTVAEATVGQTGEGVVTAHDRTTSRVTLDTDGNGSGDRVYSYGTGHTYEIGDTAQPRSTFVSRLTRGDTLEVEAYTAAGTGSRFDITADSPTAPAVTAARGGTPATAGTITVTVTPGQPSAVATYDRFVVERAPVTTVSCGTTPGSVGTFSPIADEAASRDADGQTAGFQYVDRPAGGCYRYRAAGVVDGQQSPFGTSGDVSSAPPAMTDTTRPLSTSATVSRDVGSSGTADAGDQLTIVFDETLAAAPADAFVVVRRQDGQLVVLRNQSGTLFRVSGGALTIDLGIGVNVGPYPLTITEAGRITDPAGNTWSVDTSPDRVLDK
jgi:hypothetical protein